MSKRVIAGLGGVIGGLAALRVLVGRRQPSGGAPHVADARAEELRRKLDESRALVEEREEFEAGETPVDRAEHPPPEIDERRRQVHDEGRAAVDRMRRRPRA